MRFHVACCRVRIRSVSVGRCNLIWCVFILLFVIGIMGSPRWALAATPTSTGQTPSSFSALTGEPALRLAVAAGGSRVLQTRDVERVAVADPSVADVVVISRSEVLVNGIAPGRTTLHIWQKGGRTGYTVDVLADSKQMVDELRRLLNLSGVVVWAVKQAVILDGTVADEAQRDRAGKLAAIYTDQVVDLLKVDTRTDAAGTDLAAQVSKAIGDSRIKVRIVDRSIVLEGAVGESFSAKRAVQLAEAYGQTVINLIQVVAPGGLPEPLDRRIAVALGNPAVIVSQYNDVILLEGTVESDVAKRKAEAVASAYSDRVVSLIEVAKVAAEPPTSEKQPSTPTEQGAEDENTRAEREAAEQRRERARKEQRQKELAAEVEAAIGDAAVRVRVVEETVILEGEIGVEFQRVRAEAIAKAFGSPVVNLLRFSDVPSNEVPSKSVSAQPETAAQESATNDAAAKEAADREAAARRAEQEQRQRELPRRVGDAIGDQAVRVRLIEETLFLEGTVRDEHAQARALEIAAAFGVKVVDLLQVAPPLPPAIPSPDDAAQLAARRAAEENAELQRRLTVAIGDASVSVRILNQSVFLEGEVADDFARTRAELIATAFGIRVVNLLQVRPPDVVTVPLGPAAGVSSPSAEEQAERAKAAEELRRQAALDELAKAIGDPHVRVRLVGETVVVEGVVDSKFRAERAEKLAQLYFSKVLSMFQIVEPAVPAPRTQVVLQVQVVELDRTAADKLGTKWGGVERGVFLPDQLRFLSTNPNLPYPLQLITPIGMQLDFLVSNGVAKLLAAPSLVTLSGKEASFLAGGEIPFAFMSDDKMVIEWKEYGVKLRVLPTVEADGEISVHLMPEVSVLDWANGIRANTLLLPALKTRRAETNLRLKNGQTLVLGGLLQTEESKQIEKVPVLGDLPIIGRLFQSETFKRGQSDLLFFVTPRLMNIGESPTGESILNPPNQELPGSEAAKPTQQSALPADASGAALVREVA